MVEKYLLVVVIPCLQNTVEWFFYCPRLINLISVGTKKIANCNLHATFALLLIKWHRVNSCKILSLSCLDPSVLLIYCDGI